MPYYSDEENAYIIENYSEQLIEDIARYLNRPIKNVYSHISRMIKTGKLDKKYRFCRRPWAEEEINFLNSMFGILPDEVIAKQINRSVKATVRYALRVLKITRRMNIYPMSTTARIFGISEQGIKAWVKRGWIKARRSGTNHPDARDWNIDLESLVRFAQTMCWAYDHTRMQEGEYLTEIARKANTKDPWVNREEAAQILGVSPCTIKRYVLEGKLLAKRRPTQGNRWGNQIIRRADLISFAERYIEAQWVA